MLRVSLGKQGPPLQIVHLNHDHRWNTSNIFDLPLPHEICLFFRRDLWLFLQAHEPPGNRTHSLPLLLILATCFTWLYFCFPVNMEHAGDVSNLLFCNGWIDDDNGWVFIYYVSSDTPIHAAAAVFNIRSEHTSDAFNSAGSVKQRLDLMGF